MVVRDPATIAELANAQQCLGDVSLIIVLVGQPRQGIGVTLVCNDLYQTHVFHFPDGKGSNRNSSLPGASSPMRKAELQNSECENQATDW